MSTERTLLTTAEASKIFGIPERTIRQWAADGRLSVLWVGGRNWYRVGELYDLIKFMRKIPEQRHATE